MLWIKKPFMCIFQIAFLIFIGFKTILHKDFNHICKTILAVIRLQCNMKKFLSISFSLLILLAGMHLTVSTHFCGGVIAASKVSVSGELASCGMEGPVDQCQLPGKHIGSNCCTNKIAVLAVENNYTPSSFEFKLFSQTVLQVFDIPSHTGIIPFSVLNLISTNVRPPGHFMVSAVSLPDICVFRI
jgi:hypothetical protein